jgi:menaquinone-dependent protoporphyrinogen oxidase
MNVLVTYGSKMGGTAGLADMLGAELAVQGIPTDVCDASSVGSLDGYDAVVVGGALYAGRWHRDARRFVKRRTRELRDREVFMFSSGPLDDTADAKEIPPTRQVRRLMERVRAREHRTFGGWLPADAKGVAASAMAKSHSGDWRNPEVVSAWADHIAQTLRSSPAVPR